MEYQIRVEGELGQEWADWFESSAIAREGTGVTVLTCAVADQAALLGFGLFGCVEPIFVSIPIPPFELVTRAWLLVSGMPRWSMKGINPNAIATCAQEV